MGGIAIVGAQWGDEGKGKIVHMLSEHADVVCRYQGGNNAGHTVVTGSKKWVLHLIPSGILKEGKVCIIGNGVVVNPLAFREELETLIEQGVNPEGRLYVSDRAHVIMPYHLALESAYEETQGIGTTKRGIGPAYTYKYARIGIRVCDLFEPTYIEKMLDRALEVVNTTLVGHYHKNKITKEEMLDTVDEYAEILRPYIADTSRLLHEYLQDGKKVLYEGAQGVLLDVDFGTYPYVTSSNPMAGGICTGLGVGPRTIDRVIGISKAYTTRVGSGPFPTELNDEIGEEIRKRGGEYGASTGRPRRCGWMDVVATRYALEVSGVDFIAMTKFDILDGFKVIKVCTSYEIDGKNTEYFPSSVAKLERARPSYVEFPGWGKTSGITSYEALPQNAKNYIEALEKMLGVPIALVSNGSDERDTIVKLPDVLGLKS